MAATASAPQRGFTRGEFEARLERAQAAMARDQMDALVVTSPPNVRYFSGFATQFWESPTRPWFLVVPRQGNLIAVIPEIGAPGMARTWVDDIRTWPAPVPEDDGLTLLRGVLEALPRRFGRIGWEMGREQVIRMPIRDFDTLRHQVSGLDFVDGSPTIWDLRMVKSAAEIDHIRHICQIASGLVMWDNRCTMHRGLPFDDHRWPRDAQRATTLDVASTCEQEGISVAAE